MEQYCIYLRKSRADMEAEAHGEGETLARHEKILLDVAKRDGYYVTEIYREIVSGETIEDRPVMQKLLQEVEQEIWAGVLVVEVERLARGDTIDQGTVARAFKFSGTKIITPVKTYNPSNEFDEEYFEFGLYMSRREYKTINRRLQQGRLASVKEGKYVGNKAPYGYRRIKLEQNKGFTLEPVPDEAEIIRLIFELYTVGEPQPDGTRKRLGVSLIVRRLNALKVPTRTGGDWVPASVRDILTNPVYYGKVRWGWRPVVKRVKNNKVLKQRPRTPEACVIVDGLHQPIISQETFDLAQKLMAKNPPRPISERGVVKNPLAGLIFCGKCGRRMVRRPSGPRNRTDTLMCPVTSCPNVSSPVSLVEQRLLSGLADWLSGYRLEWNLDAPHDSSLLAVKRKAAKQISAGLAKLEKQHENVYDFLEQGVYSREKFLERSRLLTDKIQKAKDDLAAVNAEIELEVKRESSRRNIVPQVENILSVYYELPDAKSKNDLLKSVLEKVIYTKEHGGRWHNPPDKFELILCPKLPDSSKGK